ncbi:MAG: DUF503 domain-containing protein [Streptosporangiales bacterium]|nr:DUF503 domain-containing protein [Streptosporangiales bacterium]
MFVGALELDLLLGDVRSLKQKRSVVRPVVAELRRRLSVAAAEVDGTDVHRRVTIAVAVVSGSADHCQHVLEECERLVAGRPELDVLSARHRLFGDDD